MVRHYCAGGREQGGGIGRLVGYIVDTAESGGVGHAVVDTRGPRWAPATSLARLVMAVLLMTWDRIVAPDRIHHIHIAGRGSTLRKLVLAAAARSLGCIHLLHLHDYDYADDLRGVRLGCAATCGICSEAPTGSSFWVNEIALP